MSIGELSEYTRISKYALHVPELGRRETREEGIARVMAMHRTQYKDQLEKFPELKFYVDEAETAMLERRVLGSQRTAQFGGPPVLAKPARGYNCFRRNTAFVTSQGVKTFEDYNDGDRILVLTHLGNWKQATVKHYGSQPVNRIIVGRGKAVHEVYATEDHRWIKNDGTITTTLEVGTRLLHAPEVIRDWDGRGETSLFTTIDTFVDTPQHSFVVRQIERGSTPEPVWCLEVEDDQSFVLPFGLSTGNCCFSHCSRPRFFQEMFWLLLCGCGTGFSVQRRHVNMLPKIRQPTGPTREYVIPDTIEGWADALGVLLSSYFIEDQPFPEWSNVKVVFNGSLIRKKGAPLSSGSKAPGPEPLLRALELTRERLDEVLEVARRGAAIAASVLPSNGHNGHLMLVADVEAALDTIDAYDIALYSADAVRSGGVRRSATIALFSHDDERMAKAKTGNWREHNRQRERANNSAVLLRGSTTFEEYWQLFQWTKEFGEPGVVWVDDLDQGMNPCVEAALWALLDAMLGDAIIDQLLPGSTSGIIKGEGDHVMLPGWQFCNLSTMNMGLIKTRDAFLAACRAATTLGTLQAGYVSFDYLGPVSEIITAKEALLGVSMTAMCDSPEIAFDPEVLRAGAAEVLRVNELIAGYLNINCAARIGLLKPEGTGTLTLDSFATGVHAWKHERGIRHAGAGDNENPFLHFQKYNPHAIYERKSGEKIIAFPYEAPKGAMIQSDINALDMLRRVRLVQKNWVEPSRRPERCVRPFLMHNVSNTIDVDEHEWRAVAEYIYEHREDFVGVSMLPVGGDKKYYLAPYTEVKTYGELSKKYGAFALGQAFELSRLAGEGPDSWEVIDHAANASITELSDDQGYWRRKFNLLAERLGGNVELAIDLVKDAELIRRWNMLREKTVPVPWSEMHESEDNVDFGAEAACAGGQCLVDLEALVAAAGAGASAN